MRIRTLLSSIAGLGMLLALPVRAEDDSQDDVGYAWLSDSEGRQPNAVGKVVGVGLTESLLAEVTAPAPPPVSAQSPFREETPKAATPAASEPMGGGVVVADDDGPCTPCPETCEPGWFKLLKFQALEDARIDVRGWIDQGVTWNPDRPANRFNGPVAYNDRSNEYQLNQAYLIAQRAVDNGGCGWDWGGRIDLLYGTDYRFVQAIGLETAWDQAHRFYGLALPQWYGEVAVDKLTVRAGHFYAPCGYETAMAPDNFFYSHSYTFLYGQPRTLTGAMLTYKLNDRLSANAGLDAGWNAWESINDKAGVLAGFTWITPDQRTTLSFEIFVNNQQLTGENVRSQYALVLARKFNDRLTYAFEHDYGRDDDAVSGQAGPRDAAWCSFAHYVVYTLNPCWSLGVRYEWFDDEDGLVIAGLGNPHGINLSPAASQWNALSVGVNYKPNANVVLRSELRWDWVNPRTRVPNYPFDDFTKGGQFLWGADLIVKF